MNPSSIKGRVRADVWRAALDAHEAGRVRVAEVDATALEKRFGIAATDVDEVLASGM